MDADDISKIESLVQATRQSVSVIGVLSTLLIMPCSGGKKLNYTTLLPVRRVEQFISRDKASILNDGRRCAFEKVDVDLSSPQRPALDYYTGQPYASPQFKLLLDNYLQHVGHALILSGAYGLLRPEEPIHNYKGHLQKTASIWKGLIPDILRDYVQRNRITRTFGSFSKEYAKLVPLCLTNEDWRFVPDFDRSQDDGVAMQVVPEQVGTALNNLLRNELQLDASWRRS